MHHRLLITACVLLLSSLLVCCKWAGRLRPSQPAEERVVIDRYDRVLDEYDQALADLGAEDGDDGEELT